MEPRPYKGFLIRDRPRGETLILQSGQAEEALRFMQASGIDNLELNCSIGYDAPDISCLTDFTFLRGLYLILTPDVDLGPIHRLGELRELSIECRHSKCEVDFGCFPSLEDCFIGWWPGIESIFACSSLKHLYLNPFNRGAISGIEQLERLEALQIANSNVSSLEGVSSLRRLTHLELHYLARLNEFCGLQDMKLERLIVDNCRRIDSIDGVRPLSGLKTLSISDDGDIATLEPISCLPSLEELFFVGSTKILDGDLSTLDRTPPLKKVLFRNRRHYSRRNEEFAGYHFEAEPKGAWFEW